MEEGSEAHVLWTIRCGRTNGFLSYGSEFFLNHESSIDAISVHWLLSGGNNCEKSVLNLVRRK